MIELRLTESGRRTVITCDTCSMPIDTAVAGVAVPWATSTALFVHRGCLAGLRDQYPSTAGEEPLGLEAILDELVAVRQAADMLPRLESPRRSDPTTSRVAAMDDATGANTRSPETAV